MPEYTLTVREVIERKVTVRARSLAEAKRYRPAPGDSVDGGTIVDWWLEEVDGPPIEELVNVTEA